jgi:hypothetical protein
LKKWIPSRIKIVIPAVFTLTRRCLSPTARKITKCQKRFLEENYDQGTKKLIVFLTLGVDTVSGGILSISSIFEETKKLKYIHGAETLLCTYPTDMPLLKYTWFKNNNVLFDFSQALSYFNRLEQLIIHIPEGDIPRFLWCTPINDRLMLRRIKNKQINVMIQNIEMLPSMKFITKLGKLGKLTCTTAHKRYATTNLRNMLGFPLHYLSIFVSPEQYQVRKYAEKENLMIVSNDLHPKKKVVMDLLARQFPHLKTQIIENLTYEEYKKTISRAKWALTFGEGLDGYFVETIFSGGISFAVYNTKFFMRDFISLRTVYKNYDILSQKICKDIADLDDELAYSNYQNEQYALCHKHYDYREYLDNLKAFYKQEYTYE